MAQGSPAQARRRVRAALELVHAPETRLFREVVGEDLSPGAREHLWRLDCAMLRHAWLILERVYGVRHGQAFFSVHRAGDPRNCLLLTADADHAARVASLWAGSPAEVAEVQAGDEVQERYVSLALALHWHSPTWLLSEKT